MFERYTDKAKRVIFFARYEASNFGSPYIDTEHLMLGLLREDKPIVDRFFYCDDLRKFVLKKIEANTTICEKVSTSAETPLSDQSEQVLNFVIEEANRLGDWRISTEHILLGLLRLQGSSAAKIFEEYGLDVDKVRSKLASPKKEPSALVALDEIKDLFFDGGEELLKKYNEDLVTAFKRGYKKGLESR